jgi:peptidoglycan hydrolase CwlO-like protein
MKRNLLDIALVAVIVLLIIFNTNSRNYYEGALETLKQEYKDEYNAYEQQLHLTRMERDSLVFRFDSLNFHLQNVRGELSKTEEELKSVKGKYDKHTPTELELEMEKKFNARK